MIARDAGNRPGKRRAAMQVEALGLGLQRRWTPSAEQTRETSTPAKVVQGYFNEIDFLSLLTESNRRRLVAGSRRADHRGGDELHHSGGPQSAAIVKQGLIRVFWNGPDGRQATIAFIGSGELVGGTTLMGGQWSGASVQAVVDTTLLWLDVEAARRAAATEMDVSSAVATHLAAQVKNLSTTIAVRSLGNVSQRLAFDILERACRGQLENGRLEARATHSDLADSIGSSREVVSRAIKDLRVAGIVETLLGAVRVIDPERLAGIVRGFEFQVTQSVA